MKASITAIAQSQLCENILQYYNKSTTLNRIEGRMWYKSANWLCQKISKKYNVKPMRIAALLAVFSINQSWEKNQELVISYLTGERKGMKMVLDKADAIMACNMDYECIKKILKGMKIYSFFMNIWNDGNSYVTIDRWAQRVAFGSFKKMTNKEYDYLKDSYVLVAKHVGILPSHLQAITWIAIRENQIKI